MSRSFSELSFEVLEARDTPSAAAASLVAPAPAPAEAGYSGTHALYQDVVIPTSARNQGWGKWEVNLAR